MTISPEIIKAWIRVLLFPSCWFQNGSYSRVWDAKLRMLMKNHTFKPHGPCTARLGSALIWIGNFPYACMRPYGYGTRPLVVRPSRTTILIAYDKFIEDSMRAYAESTETGEAWQ